MDRYQAALEALALQEVPQYAETARAFGVDASNLSKRWRGKTGSRAEYIDNQSLLNNQQVRTLIREINQLSERGTPPTVAMVQTFAGHLAQKLPGKNWANDFVKAHRDELKSVYL